MTFGYQFSDRIYGGDKRKKRGGGVKKPLGKKQIEKSLPTL